MTLARHASPLPSNRLTRARATEADHNALRNAHAVRIVASQASDVEDCCELLAMLGLDPTEAK